MKPFDVFGVGRAVVDYSVLVPRYPAVDEKTEAVGRFYGSGSPVPNALCQLARWGHRTGLSARVGNDRDGEVFLRDLESFGVETEQVLKAHESSTPRAHIWVEQGSGRRTVVLDRDIAPLSTNELPFSDLQNTRFLLIDGYEADAAIEAAKIVRKAGGQVMIDAGSVRDRMDEQLSLADWIVVPVAFVRSYYGSVDLFEVVRDLKSRGAQAAVVTNGGAGCVAAWEDRVEWMRAYPVQAVDTTGAGDVFHAGFLHGLLKEWPVPECVRWASASAALAATALGGRACLPTENDVNDLVRQAGEDGFSK